VRGLVERMTALHSQSKQISEIVGIIDGIAFQTNILALNASVEAARAGDMGRGFAVVAQEVRALAQRSAASARQISEIVEKSTAEIERGTELANSAGSDVANTVSTAQGVARMMESVRMNSEEQRIQVNESHKAINQVASATQGNAALVEEVAAATGSLDSNGRELLTLVGEFKLGNLKL
jgi:methyl-accepting chemotaxis protein